MSDGISTSELEERDNPKIVVISDGSGTCTLHGAGVSSSELKPTDNSNMVVVSDGASCDMVVQSQAKSAKVTSVDINGKKSPKLTCSASNSKPADSGPSPPIIGVKAPAIVKGRGHPRGHNLTTIGLPAKEAKKESVKKPCSFSKMYTSKKEEGRSLYTLVFTSDMCVCLIMHYVYYDICVFFFMQYFCCGLLIKQCH